MAKTFGLGRGLDSLLPDTESKDGGITEIKLGDLDPNPDQPRKAFDEEGIRQLADSIREQGVLQPLLVTPVGSRYRIVAGERRYRASRAAGLDKVPCIVRSMDMIHQMEAALVENLQREDLNPIEAAKAIRALMQQCGYTQEKVSARLGKSRPAVANLLRLLSLPDAVSKMVEEGSLSAGHARVLAGIDNRDRLLALARAAVREGMSVRQLEDAAAKEKKAGENAKTGKAAGKRLPQLPPELRELQDRLRERTGMKPEMAGTTEKGKIVLHYASRDELERLSELLGEE